MIYEEAKHFADSLDPPVRETFDAVRGAYVRLRDRLKDTTTDISRRMWQKEYGHRMRDICEFAEAIEVLEASTTTGAPDPNAALPPKSILSKPLLAAIDNVKAVMESDILAIGTVEYRRFQELALREKTTNDAVVGDVKNASREVAAESRDFEKAFDKLKKTEAERDAAAAQAKAANDALEIDRAGLTAAKALIATMQKSEAVLSAEISRLQEACKGLTADADRSAELRTENAVLRGRAAHLDHEVERLETIIVETEKSYAHERAAVHTAHDHALAEERRCSADREAQLLAMIASLSRGGNDKGGR